MKYDFLNPTKQLVVLLDSRVVKLDNRPDAVVCVRVVDRALGWAEDDASQPLRVLAQLVRHRDPELAAEADAVVDGEHHVATPTRGAPGGRSPAPTHYDSFDAWARDHLIVKVVR